jgi:hypothetical protein
MKDLYNTLLVHIFYTIGDVISRLPEWCFRVDFTSDFYEWCMQKSQEFDERLDYKFWVEPSDKY